MQCEGLVFAVRGTDATGWKEEKTDADVMGLQDEWWKYLVPP